MQPKNRGNDSRLPATRESSFVFANRAAMKPMATMTMKYNAMMT